MTDYDFEEIRFSILESYKAVCKYSCDGTGRLIYAETFSEDMDIQLKKRFEKMRDSLYTSIDAYSAKRY